MIVIKNKKALDLIENPIQNCSLCILNVPNRPRYLVTNKRESTLDCRRYLEAKLNKKIERSCSSVRKEISKNLFTLKVENSI